MLGEGVVALRLEVELRPAGGGVEEERLLDGRDERVADPTEHGVEGPDGEAVLAALLERLGVVAQVLLGVVRVEPETLGRRRADPPAAGLHVRSRHRRERLGMPALVVDEHDRMEDLERLMCVERRHDLRQAVKVAVDELAQPARVVQRARAGPPGDEELEARRAEGVLDVDDHEGDSESVGGGRQQTVLFAPALRIREPRGIVDAPDLGHAVRIPVRGQRERICHGSSVGT